MESQDTRSRGPLTGIRVIEVADEQAEYCGLTLAGLGAEVSRWAAGRQRGRGGSVPLRGP